MSRASTVSKNNQTKRKKIAKTSTQTKRKITKNFEKKLPVSKSRKVIKKEPIPLYKQKKYYAFYIGCIGYLVYIAEVYLTAINAHGHLEFIKLSIEGFIKEPYVHIIIALFSLLPVHTYIIETKSVLKIPTLIGWFLLMRLLIYGLCLLIMYS